MKLRQYQQEATDQTYAAWDSSHKNVLLVLPTRSGKTVVFSKIIEKHNEYSCAIVHRKELVGQISLALARNGVRHKIIGPKKLVRYIVNLHMKFLRKSFYDPASKVAVASVDTLIRRHDELKAWCESVTLWVLDETHHLLKDNKWGKAVAMFPNARGLGVTATACRTDGKGLGRHVDGVMDVMIIGATMRYLINIKYITEYKIYAPPNDLDLSNVPVSKVTGDYNPIKLKKAIRKSHIIGDIVKHYKQFANKKSGITFATDVETATDITAQFNANGVPAMLVTADTPDAERDSVQDKLINREIDMIVNVDLYGEGYDSPAIEVVIMARPTESFSLFCQQFARCLTIMDGKTHGIIIDMVGNVVRSDGTPHHGLPDAVQHWTLDRREKRSKSKASDVIPVKSCPECTAVYERIYKSCPFCGHTATPSARNGPDQVDGDLTEITPDVLAAMRGEINIVDMSTIDYKATLIKKYVPIIGQLSLVKRHVERQEAQEALRLSIAWWGAYQREAGRPDFESYRRFYFKFGIDVLTAQTLKTKEALQLASNINNHLGGCL